MPTTATRWNLQVSTKLDSDLRKFLATEKKLVSSADIAAFVEDAVRERIFELTCEAVKARNSSVSPELIEVSVDDALKWARQQ